MKISTKGRYGLRAILDLAVHSENGEAVNVQSIAARQNISESYLEQLVRKMRKAGLIESVRGAGGGYRLAMDASEISAGDILRACEGSIEAVSCCAGDSDQNCIQAEICVTHSVWNRVNKAIEEVVDSIYLDHLVNESRKQMKDHKVDTAMCRN